MRSGGYTLHHSLTLEAASIVKQALTLARRRGHSQVTPLHVASAMLASPTGLLKGACLKSHSHPLQCKALELCFNVALNRLPTSASSPLLGPQSHLPSLSNALVAAFKRAQAHQRRGSIESQQQPILALKVEVEQLVISILDDPSVSRVMREAGFSSTQVKSNVEQTVTLEKSTPILTSQSKESKMLVLGHTISQTQTTPSLSQFRLPSSISNKTLQNNEVLSVLEAMANKKTRNTVVVGECRATNESIINGVIEKINRNDVAPELKSLQFISVPLSTLKNVSREEFEIKIGELRSLMKSYVSRGVVLYLGDLDWVSGFWAKFGEQRSVFFCPVEYMIMELSRLACGSNGDNRRVWIMGFASSQTYAKCRIGRPSLEALWSLHPLTVPVGTLALSLSLDSGMHEEVKKEPLMEDYSWLSGIKKNLICCSDCSENFMKEAEAVTNGEKELLTSSSSRLPSWLQQYKDIENRKQLQESDGIKDLCNKWNSICNSVHRKPHFLERVFNISSSSPSSSSSLSSNRRKAQKTWPTIFELGDDASKPAGKPELLSNPNSSPNSASSSEASGDVDYGLKFDQLSSENVRLLTNALENKVPWHRVPIVDEVVTVVLKCRSGMMRSRRQDSWLLFSGGGDSDGREAAARELAKAVFGSRDESFVAVGTSSCDSTTEEVSKKRARDERGGGSVFERFCDAVRCNPSRVFCVGDADRIGDRCLRAFERAMRDGSVDGGDVLLKDAIVVFSSESRACSPSGKREKEEREEEKLLDLNVATEDDGNEDGDRIGILGSVDMQVVFESPNAVN